jgi:hypothetical protein
MEIGFVRQGIEEADHGEATLGHRSEGRRGRRHNEGGQWW